MALGVAALALTASVLGIGAVASATGSDAAQSSSADTGKALVAERCILCHDLAVVTSRHASAEEWHAIIDRMIMNGAQVTESEEEAIISYLVKLSAAPQSASAESRDDTAADRERATDGGMRWTAHTVLRRMGDPDS